MNHLIEQEISQVSNQSFEISNENDLLKINAVLKGIKGLKQKVKDELDPRVEEAHKAHKGLTALRSKYLKPLEEVEVKINIALKSWQIKKEEEARLLQEKINKDLVESADKLRKEKEQEALKSGDEWSKEIALEEIKEIKTDTVALDVCKESVITKVEGQYKRSNWKAKIVNKDLVPKEFWIIDEKALDAVAKTTKGDIEIPGVEFYDDFTIVTKL